jgi:hypothetical protein
MLLLVSHVGKEFVLILKNEIGTLLEKGVHNSKLIRGKKSFDNLEGQKMIKQITYHLH